jgi:hypothetical protein
MCDDLSQNFLYRFYNVIGESPFSSDYQYFKMKRKKYHTVETVPKSNRKIVKRGKINNPNTHIHDRSLSWLSTGVI